MSHINDDAEVMDEEEEDLKDGPAEGAVLEDPDALALPLDDEILPDIAEDIEEGYLLEDEEVDDDMESYMHSGQDDRDMNY